MTVMALMAVRQFALFTSRPQACGSTRNVADAGDTRLRFQHLERVPSAVAVPRPTGCTRFSAAWRRRACRSCRSTVCSATAAQKRSTKPSSPAVSRTRSRFWIRPTDGSFLPFSTSDRVRGRAAHELGERVQAQPLGRPEPPDLSAEIRPPGNSRVQWVRRPTKPAGSTAHRWNLVLHCSPPAELLRHWTENPRTSFRVLCCPMGTARTSQTLPDRPHRTWTKGRTRCDSARGDAGTSQVLCRPDSDDPGRSNMEGVPRVDRALVAVIEDGMVLEVPGAPAVCEMLGRASGGACPRPWRGRSVPRRDVCCDLVSWTDTSASVLAGS